ncbi:hypothetical protein DLB95_28270 [Salmonella enterica subsp. diarizonae]|uniref:Uncharacterized protein n=3 Tax=Salmonella enterica TaxID=28901 RepID=A0A403T6E7_SALER|nr:hypothetical protein [Salmonella enterica subsp. diarizonae]EAC0789716.1 hypothetical protein [Salmonella enterica subsp. enterica serovar Java]EAU6348441.1 hypothetical protein [Salmonella enterica]EBX7469946.1 hypothetical protein [Salmonella enterica subsp. enterica serovar Bareilly]ECE0793484.1 hypothetical protein [Salmonella enterica subsp. diarizonae]
MLGGADNANGELPSYITGANISNIDADHRITKWVKSDPNKCYSAILLNVISRSSVMLLGGLTQW